MAMINATTSIATASSTKNSTASIRRFCLIQFMLAIYMGRAQSEPGPNSAIT